MAEHGWPASSQAPPKDGSSFGVHFDRPHAAPKTKPLPPLPPRLNARHVLWALLALFNGGLVGSIVCIVLTVQAKPELALPSQPLFVGMLVCAALTLGALAGLVSHYLKMQKQRRLRRDRPRVATVSQLQPTRPAYVPTAPAAGPRYAAAADHTAYLAHLQRQLDQEAHSARIRQYLDDDDVTDNVTDNTHASPASVPLQTAVAQRLRSPGPAMQVAVHSAHGSQEKVDESDGADEDAQRDWRDLRGRLREDPQPAFAPHDAAAWPLSVVAPRPRAAATTRGPSDPALAPPTRGHALEAEQEQEHSLRASQPSPLSQRPSITPAPSIPPKSALRAAGTRWWAPLARKVSLHHSAPVPPPPVHSPWPERKSSLPKRNSAFLNRETLMEELPELGWHPALAPSTQASHSGSPALVRTSATPKSIFVRKRDSPVAGPMAPTPKRPRTSWSHAFATPPDGSYSGSRVMMDDLAPLAPLAVPSPRPPPTATRRSEAAAAAVAGAAAMADMEAELGEIGVEAAEASLGEIVDEAASEAYPRTPRTPWTADLEPLPGGHEGLLEPLPERRDGARSSSSSEILDLAAARRRAMERHGLTPKEEMSVEKMA